MSTDALAKLGRNALAFGETYAALKEALVKQGVTENEAREEARNAATLAAFVVSQEGDPCPLCGRGV